MASSTVVEGTGVATCERIATTLAMQDAEHKVTEWQSAHPGDLIARDVSTDTDHDGGSFTAKVRIRVTTRH